MKETDRIIISIAGNNVWEHPARSLRWRGDTLIDWASGGVRYELDGSCSGPAINYAYPFDHTAVSSDGLYVTIVTRLGTKGLILKDGRIIREINRSFYYANAYEYPIAFLNLPDGGTAIAHCPDEYCKLEIFDDALVYDLGRAIEQPESLDADTNKDFPLSQTGVMITSVAFAESGLLVVTATDDYYDPDDIDPTEQDLLGYYQIGVYDLYAKSFRRKAQLTEPAGELMPLGENYAIGFYQHPKLIDLKTGAILRKWEELNSGDQLGSIIWHLEKKLPPLALDPVNKRFAVASEREITVIQLG